MTQSASARAPGALDATFSFDGKAYTPTSLDEGDVAGAAVRPGGGIVVAGGSIVDLEQNNFAFVGFKPDGSLDTSFGGDGIVEVPFGSTYGFDATGVALQSDGKIVAIGYSSDEAQILRLNLDGSLDTGFGVAGKVVVPSVRFEAITVESDDDLVVVGSAQGAKRDFFIARFTPSGVPDPTFSGDGSVLVAVSAQPDEASDVGLLSDGSIVAGGWYHGPSNLDFALVRVSSAGVPVPSFDGDGIVTTPVGTGRDQAYALAVQANDRIVLGGRSIPAGIGEEKSDLSLVRFMTDGSLDPTFDTDGILVGDYFRHEGINDLAMLGDGRILAVGGARGGWQGQRIALAYSDTGVLDPGFGDGGIAAGLVNSSTGNALALDASGAPVIAGGHVDRSLGARWMVARLTEATSPDVGTAVKVNAPKELKRRGKFTIKGKLTSPDPACRAQQEVALGTPSLGYSRDTAPDGSFRFTARSEAFWKTAKKARIRVEYEGTGNCQPAKSPLIRIRLV